MKKTHNHDWTWIYPTQDELPDQEARLEYLRYFMPRPRDLDTVICKECGMTGHKINSRRSGIRWHTSAGVDHWKEKINHAIQVYRDCRVEVPAYLQKQWS